jgi:leucyl aminopeptidase
MQITVSTLTPQEIETSCLIIPVWQDEALEGVAAQIDKSIDGLISQFIEDGFKGSSGDVRIIYRAPEFTAERTIIVGLGKRDKFQVGTLHKAISRAARTARGIKRSGLAVVLPSQDKLSPQALATGVAEAVTLGLHQFNDFKTDEDSKSAAALESLILVTDAKHEKATQEGAEYGQISSAANLRARGWVNLPSNRKSPQFLAAQAQSIADEHGLICEIWDENKLQEENMGAFYGVGKGSDNPPRLIKLEYAPEGKADEAPFILVGKGVTFDSGGYSLKPASSMEDMKDDMAGAAVVIAAMEAVAKLKPNRRIIGLVGSVENMISGRAQRPGDIVTARNGKTIEILNTDAEGRLVLADVLCYASEHSPTAIIDFATLTGAIGIALGTEAAGLFSNDDELSEKLQQAGQNTHERVWRFPLWEEYRDHIKGRNSDIKNTGIERRAGSISAAAFLEHFVTPGTPWAHIDIAAVAYLREDKPLSAFGATGFGVRLVLELIKEA